MVGIRTCPEHKRSHAAVPLLPYLGICAWSRTKGTASRDFDECRRRAAKSPTAPRMALLTPRLGRECSTDYASVPGGLVLH